MGHPLKRWSTALNCTAVDVCVMEQWSTRGNILIIFKVSAAPREWGFAVRPGLVAVERDLQWLKAEGVPGMCRVLEWLEEQQRFDREKEGSNGWLRLFRNKMVVQVLRECFGCSPRGDGERGGKRVYSLADSR